MSDRALSWRAEEAFLRAWPALRQEPCGDWLLRFAEGHSRRASSANPMRADMRDTAAAIAACEDRYRAARQPPIFRIPSFIVPAIDARLDRIGYRAEGETCTLYADLGGIAPLHDADSIEVSKRPAAEWLAAVAAMQELPERNRVLYARIVGAIAIPAAFLAVRVDNRIVAAGYGAVHDRLLCCESVVTDSRHRRHGHARRLMAALFAWGRRMNATAACLQVTAANAAARQLYHGLGLRTELYRYHYRCKPQE